VTGRQLLPVEGVHDTAGMYSHVAQGSGLLFIAGQIARDPSGLLVGPGDVVAQTRQVIANLSTILAAAGSDLDSVLKLTVYLTRRSDLPGYRQAREEALPAPRPPTTLVFVDGLADPEYLIEIEAVALAKAGPAEDRR
jgi:enamine deaminase RidA (YjgF/YER057c/UK114 family)